MQKALFKDTHYSPRNMQAAHREITSSANWNFCILEYGDNQASASWGNDLAIMGAIKPAHFYRNTGETPTGGTGPTADHTSSFGTYLFLEATSPSVKGKYLSFNCFSLT